MALAPASSHDTCGLGPPTRGQANQATRPHTLQLNLAAAVRPQIRWNFWAATSANHQGLAPRLNKLSRQRAFFQPPSHCSPRPAAQTRAPQLVPRGLQLTQQERARGEEAVQGRRLRPRQALPAASSHASAQLQCRHPEPVASPVRGPRTSLTKHLPACSKEPPAISAPRRRDIP